MFNDETMPRMHPSFSRLLECARQATASAAVPIRTQTDLARDMIESPQRIQNWKTRGVSKEGALKAQALYRASATYILEGVRDGPIDSVKFSSPEGGMAQLLSYAENIVESTELPTLDRREKVETKDLPLRFKMLVDDESMSPKIKPGTWVAFERADTAIPGRRVLVRTRLGNLYFRRYREPDEAGRWKAAPDHPDYQTYDSEEHGLTIVARVLHIELRDED